MPLQENLLEPLKAAGLLISGPFVPHHLAFPSGYAIGKPKSAGGNALPHYEVFWAGKVLCDAPSCYLHERLSTYYFTVEEKIPGPGFGDFVRTFETGDEAVRAILDYYFGDPDDMNNQLRDI